MPPQTHPASTRTAPFFFGGRAPARTAALLDDDARFPRTRRFRQEQHLGGGGGGDVWSAWDRDTARKVALKCLRPRLAEDSAAVARFEREAWMTARLVHPGIPRIYDAGVLEDGTRYYAQRLVEGPTLEAALARRRPLDYDLLVRFSRICWAVAYAHGQRVVHLDIKPANILLGPGHSAILVDWGIARRLDDPAPAHASVMGTLGYMAPECLRGGTGAGCTASDVFSLGLTLFEVLTGSRPFRARQGLSLAVETCLRDAPDPRSVHRAVPVALAVACKAALNRDPARRNMTAAGLARALEAHLETMAGEPTLDQACHLGAR